MEVRVNKVHGSSQRHGQGIYPINISKNHGNNQYESKIGQFLFFWLLIFCAKLLKIKYCLFLCCCLDTFLAQLAMIFGFKYFLKRRKRMNHIWANMKNWHFFWQGRSIIYIIKILSPYMCQTWSFYVFAQCDVASN